MDVKTANQLLAIDLKWHGKNLRAHGQIPSPLPWKRKKGSWLHIQGAASPQAIGCGEPGEPPSSEGGQGDQQCEQQLLERS